MAAERIVIDPGIGFGKKPEHNLALLRTLDRLVAARPPCAGWRLAEVLPPLARRCSGDRGQILARRRTDELLPRERRADIPGA